MATKKITSTKGAKVSDEVEEQDKTRGAAPGGKCRLHKMGSKTATRGR